MEAVAPAAAPAAPAAPAAANPAPAPAGAPRARIGDFTMGMAQNPQSALAPLPPPQAPGDQLATIPGEADALSQATAIELDDSTQAELITPEQWKELQAKWNQDELHEELHAKLVKVKIDGREYQYPVAEVAKGYMRNVDYSNKLGELAQQRESVLRARGGLERLLGDMDNGQSYLQAMRSLNKMKGFHEAAKLYAVQWNALQQMPPEQRQVWERNQEMEQKLYQTEMRNRQLEQLQQQQQQQQPDRHSQYVMNQLQQMAPIAMKKVGLEWSPFAEQIFGTHWQNMLPTLEGDLSTDFVTSVMQATKETVDAYVARSQQQVASQARQMPGVQKLPAAAPPAGQQGQAQRARIGDFSSAMRGR